jgi:hypothetical protein
MATHLPFGPSLQDKITGKFKTKNLLKKKKKTDTNIFELKQMEDPCQIIN